MRACQACFNKGVNDAQESVSLLFPSGNETAVTGERLTERSIADLGLAEIAEQIAGNGVNRAEVLDILATLATDYRAIEYRQELLDDLIKNPKLAESLRDLLPMIGEMSWYTETHRNEGAPLLQAIWRIGELELYVDCVESLHRLFEEWGDRIRSEGLRRLRAVVEEREAAPDFRSLAEELPKLREGLRKKKSVTLGINLDERLRPVEAVLLAVNDTHFREQALIARILGLSPDAAKFESALPLHQTPRPTDPGLYPTGAFPLAPLFQDLEKLLNSLSRPLVASLKRYFKVNTGFLQAIRKEIAFYVGTAALLSRLKAAGLPLCKPRLAAMGERRFVASSFYNLRLALLMLEGADGDLPARMIVTNNIRFDEGGRILILTGPNQGGKTTYTQGVGLLQVFCQAGLLVPAQEAEVSPVDHVITHFPLEEQGELEQGRLGEEAARLSELFRVVTRHSLVLLNESLSSTSPGESLYLAEDIVSAFRLLGTRVIFATHLHELAYHIDEINSSIGGESLLVSLVAGVAEGPESRNGRARSARRTYRIEVGPPMGKSYARDIAEKYGISLDRIRESLKERGVL